MSAFFQLIRYKNLLIIVGIQWLMHRTIITPLTEIYGLDIVMPDKYLFLLILATVTIAGGGNAINDYFDVRIDEINRPEKQLVGKKISRRMAMLTHQILTGIGVVTGLFISYRAGSTALAFLFIIIPGLLWFYSSAYKRQFLIGNIVVAFMAALVPFIVILFDQSFLYRIHGEMILSNGLSRQLFSWVGVYAIFSFITTLTREIVKDMQDEEGDREWESNTLPIVIGRPATKIVVGLLLITIAGGIIYILSHFQNTIATSIIKNYAIYILLIPLLTTLILVIRSKTKSDFSLISLLIKLIMIGGIMYAPIAYFIMAKLFNIPFFTLSFQ